MSDNERFVADELDDELTNLFSAFDDVRASDDLKTSTLSSILAQADREVETDRTTAEAKAFKGGGKPGMTPSRPKAKVRVFRMVAIAACLAMALTGGAAYALPASHVKLSQGNESIDLGINFFGMTVSANATGDGDDPIRTDDLKNKPYEESVAEAFDLLDARNNGAPIDLNVDANDPGRRQQMEDRGVQIMAERAEVLPAEYAAPANEPAGPLDPAPDTAPNPREDRELGPSQEPAGYPSGVDQPDEPSMPVKPSSPGAPAP